jgi:threonine-phosphate decarboxylase
MSKPIHGGGVDRAMTELGVPRDEIHDFSASINPLGTPPQVQQALTAALVRIGDYPEIDAASFCRELSRFHHISKDNLLPGSGSTELIYLLPRVFKPRRALLVQPCFSEYAPALQQVGCRIDTVSLSPNRDFAFSVEQVLAAVRPETELVMLANPGNPTGVGIDPHQLIALAEQLGDCRLLVDEAFVDFCPQLSVLAQVVELTNLLVLRSMTKFYAIPGLRVGYLAASAADIDQLKELKEPWTLSNLAIAAGKACLVAYEYRQQTLPLISRQRDDLRLGLESLGVKVFSGEANYLLCRLPADAPDALELKERLYQQGLLVRACDDFVALDECYLRVAVLGREANHCLISTLENYL